MRDGLEMVETLLRVAWFIFELAVLGVGSYRSKVGERVRPFW